VAHGGQGRSRARGDILRAGADTLCGVLRLRTALRTVAALLGVVAAAAWASGGLRLDVGPLHVSAGDPFRILFEAAGVWLVAELACPLDGRPLVARPRVALSLAAVLLAGIADSSPRRVGDGAEYVAMAVNLSRGRLPSLSPDNIVETSARLEATPGFNDMGIPLNVPAGADGRSDTYHFWLYPLLVAPLLALADLAHLHLNYAFAAVNLLLVGWFAHQLVDRGRVDVAAILCAGPMLWWIDKAHAEVFLFVTIASAVLLLDRRPGLALLAAAAATAQNSAAGVVLALCVLWLSLGPRDNRVGLSTLAAVTGLALLAPVYYWLHLGTPSPLLGTLATGVPGVRELVTPLVDLNLGLLPHAPLLVLLAAVGAASAPRRTVVLSVAAGSALLVVFAQTANANHGGTPGMSRYALWLLAVAVPLIVRGCEQLRTWRPILRWLIPAASVTMSLILFRPDWADRGGASPNALARLAWTHVPALDDPLPEVFAERMSERDGMPEIPIATSGCEKVLTIGDGSNALWPFPCTPGPAPPACTTSNALCYVNRGAFASVPRQRHFGFVVSRSHSWTATDRDRFDALLGLVGKEQRHISALDMNLRTLGTLGLEPLYIVEGNAGVAIWAQGRTDSTRGPRLRLDVPQPSTVTLLDVDSLAPMAASFMVAEGPYDVPIRPGAEALIVVSGGR